MACAHTQSPFEWRKGVMALKTMPRIRDSYVSPPLPPSLSPSRPLPVPLSRSLLNPPPPLPPYQIAASKRVIRGGRAHLNRSRKTLKILRTLRSLSIRSIRTSLMYCIAKRARVKIRFPRSAPSKSFTYTDQARMLRNPLSTSIHGVLGTSTGRLEFHTFNTQRYSGGSGGLQQHRGLGG